MGFIYIQICEVSHQTFGLANGNVRLVQWFSWTLRLWQSSIDPDVWESLCYVLWWPRSDWYDWLPLFIACCPLRSPWGHEDLDDHNRSSHPWPGQTERSQWWGEGIMVCTSFRGTGLLRQWGFCVLIFVWWVIKCAWKGYYNSGTVREYMCMAFIRGGASIGPPGA